MLNYNPLSPALEERIRTDRAQGCAPQMGFDEKNALRRDPARDKGSVLRPAFIRDCDKILHSPYYSRYADKTQVFSFYKNDDLTRRSLHVQLVSRIGRTLGRALNLNCDLIEAIALGHDIGHTPFGHDGEKYLDQLLFDRAGIHFCHNIHSVRVLDRIFPYNITLQTLSGIAAHDGELELCEYHPRPLKDFTEFDALIEGCEKEGIPAVKQLAPSTLEGCVMRISDIIAYLGKDRQDAERAGLISNTAFAGGALGTYNAEIINNLMTNIVENSYGKPYIKMDPTYFEALKQAKGENYRLIYLRPEVKNALEHTVRPMMEQLYDRLLADLKAGDPSSPIFTHHIAEVQKAHYKRLRPYEKEEPNRIVADYIASMTDDYFIDLFVYLFPKSPLRIEYKGYFE